MPKITATFICVNGKKVAIFAPAKGEMAEWSIAAVLKTVEGNTSGGSNPSFSATLNLNKLLIRLLRFFYIYILHSELNLVRSKQQPNIQLFFQFCISLSISVRDFPVCSSSFLTISEKELFLNSESLMAILYFDRKSE